MKESNTRSKLRIGVIGASEAEASVLEAAYMVGQAIGHRGAILVCGALKGVMEAAARGAKDAGALTIGILPGSQMEDANPYIDIPIVTGLGHARNMVVVQSSHAVLAIDGKLGTLSEISTCLLYGIPLVGLGTWRIQKPDATFIDIPQFQDPIQAVDAVIQMVQLIKKAKP